MRANRWLRPVALMLAGLCWTTAAVAQGSVQGRVTDQETGNPLGGARVTLLSTAGTAVAATTTADNGSYTLTSIAAGTYALQVAALGYEASRVEGVTVGAAAVTVDVAMSRKVIELNPIVTTVSKREEREIKAVQEVNVVGEAEITERPTLSVTDNLKGLPGVDISQGGLVQSNVVGRGFNNIFSGALLTMTDYRFAAVPSLRVNVPAFFPVTGPDIERMEFALGPGAAVYGPNSANGVLHIVTQSPFTSAGTVVALETGFRSSSRDADGNTYDDGHGLWRLTFRHAGTAGEKFGYKISGEYLGAEEWRAVDPAEPSSLPGRSCDPTFNCRDFDVEKYIFDARFDFRPSPGTEIIASFGRSSAQNLIEYTGIGAALARGWNYDYAHLRLRTGRFFAQTFINKSNAGNEDENDLDGTFLLRDGSPIVDKSRVVAFQLQHGFSFGQGWDLNYGADLTLTTPVTEGTINGRNEEDDNITEIGGYALASWDVSPKLRLQGALRIDNHSHLQDPVLSPRAAIVFAPTETHNFRFTYNRAFSTPTSNNLSLDIVAGAAGPYNVRALGVPEGGFRFRAGHCGPGGVDDLCMRSPFPGTPTGAIPTQAALLWAVAANAVAPVLGPLAPILMGLPAPTPAQVGTQLRRLNTTTGAWTDAAASTVLDVNTLEPTISNTLEAGYKGIFGSKFRFSASLWYEKKENFVGPLIVESPNVFLDPATTLAYLQATFQPIVRGALIQQGLPPAQADAQAAVITQQVAVGMAGQSGSTNQATRGVPLATVVPDAGLTQSSDIFLTYRNFGNVDLFGMDLAADYYFNDRWSAALSWSLVSDDFFPRSEVGGPTDIALNASTNKGSVALRFRDDPNGLTAEARGRWVKGFPVNSGVYVSSTLPDGSLEPIDSYGLMDLQGSWRLPFNRNLLAALVIENLFNENYATFVGVPQLGRLTMLKLLWTF